MNIRESQNYLRLQILVNGEGSKILRQVFKRRFQVVKKTEWEDGSRFAKEFLRTYSNSKKVLPIQRGMIKTADLNKFDMTLLSSLIHQVDSVSPGGFEGKDDIRSENASIRDLVGLRNIISHLPGKSVDMKLFQELWGKIKTCLINLGVDEETIEEIRSASELDGISFESGRTVEEETEDLKNAISAGDLSMKNHDYEKAIRNYSIALSRRGLSVEERVAVLSNRSEALVQCLQGTDMPCEDEIEENCRLALKDAEEIMRTDPELWKGYFLAGKVHKYRRDWKLGIDCFDRALALNPGLPEVVKPRDECRYEWSKAERNEHMNPQHMKTGFRQSLEKFRKERGFGADPDEVLKEMEGKLASKDSRKRAEACAFYGHLYEEGVDVEQDHSKAAKYYEEAADAGDISAMCSLGRLYIEGTGVPRSIEKGVELFEKAAKSKPRLQNVGDFKQDVAHAQHCLGVCFQDGVGKSQDFFEAARWYSKSSDNGSGLAAHNLGYAYLDGRGVSKSRERAKQYLRLAAGRGMELSMERLAWMYLEEYKADVAEDWYKQSIAGNNLNAILHKDQFYKELAKVRLAVEECQRTSGSASVEDITAKIRSLKTSSGQDPGLLEMCLASSERKQLSVVSSFEGMDFEDTLLGKIWKQEEEIQKRALAGHPYAQELIKSMSYFSKGLTLLLGYKRSRAEHRVWLQQKILENVANVFRLQEIVMFSLGPMNEDLRSICYAQMSKGKVKSEVDLNARVCYSWQLAESSSEEILPFLEVSRRKYPRETAFYKLHAGILACKNKREALRIVNQALEVFPSHPNFLFMKASSMTRLFKSTDRYKYEDVIAAYEKFLAVAPFDEREIPEVYYCMAFITFAFGKHIPNFFEIMENYYKQGLEAEARILPCFLPWEGSGAKFICEAKIKQKSQVQSNGKPANVGRAASERKPSCSVRASNLQHTNPTRIQAVVRFRQMFNPFIPENRINDQHFVPVIHCI